MNVPLSPVISWEDAWLIEHCSSPQTSNELFDFLKHWLIDHILAGDMKFKSFLAENNTLR